MGRPKRPDGGWRAWGSPTDQDGSPHPPPREQDGRWSEQKDRLYKTGTVVVFIIEGNLKDAKFPQESLLGALVSAELVDNTHVFRTWSREGATTPTLTPPRAPGGH